MPSKSYLSLLVLALAVSTVSPVHCAETQQIEDRGHTTSSAPASGSRHLARAGPGVVGIGLAITGVLLTVALVSTFYPGGGQGHSAAPPRPPTNTTQPTSPSQPNNPPQAFVRRREERDLGRSVAVDTSGQIH